MGDTTTQDLTDFAPSPPPDVRIVEPPPPAIEAPRVAGPRVDRPRGNPRITDPSVRAAIDNLPESARPAAEAEYLALIDRGTDGTATATAQRDLALAQGERAAREDYARQHSVELERYRSRRVDLPDFIPTQENAMSLGTLFGLVGVLGTMMGGRGQQSAIGAMNAMSGMMAGWRQGRADLYNRERQKYEQEMKRVQEQNNILQRDFQDALNLMKTNLDAGIARAREAAARHGVSIAGAAATRQGAEGIRAFMRNLLQITVQTENAQRNLRDGFQRVVDPDNPNRTVFYNTRTNQYLTDNTGQRIEAAPLRPAATQNAGRPIVIPETQADGSTRYFYGRPDGQFLTPNGQRVEAPPPGGGSTPPIIVEREGEGGQKDYFYATRAGALIMQNGEPVRAPAPRQPTQDRGAPIPRMIRGEDGQVRFYAADRRTGELLKDAAGELVEMAGPRGARGDGAAENRVGEITRRYNNRLATSVEELGSSLGVIGRLPDAAGPLPLAQYLSTRNPDLRRSIIQNFQDRMSRVDNQLFTALTADTARLAAALQAGGVPSGMTEAAINELKGIIPRNGQPRIMVYTFLALMKRQAELGYNSLIASGGNPEQIAQAARGLEQVRQAVPYEIEQLVDIVAGGRQTIAQTGRLITEVPANEETRLAVEKAVRLNETLTALRNRYTASPGSRGVATEADIIATMRANNMNREDVINSLVRAGYRIEAQP